MLLTAEHYQYRNRKNPPKENILPILKWAGGKRQLLNEIKQLVPSFNNYFEPFIGGGAVFLNISPQKAYISDINSELINMYKVIKDNPHELMLDLSKHKNTKEYFEYIRALDRVKDFIEYPAIQRASRFIFLNKTCFNGLYRVNNKGYFNVPFGNYKNPQFVKEDNLLMCSQLLQNTIIKCADFSAIKNRVQPKDFVYFDPPYLPINETSNFTSYTKDGFNIDMQIKLKALCDRLTNKGVYFLLSNSDTTTINELYSKYNIQKIFANRTINSKSSKRGKITELLIKNY